MYVAHANYMRRSDGMMAKEMHENQDQNKDVRSGKNGYTSIVLLLK